MCCEHLLMLAVIGATTFYKIVKFVSTELKEDDCD